jgi:Coenzyme PQQ synthesis protein D (PqqD)
MNLKQFSASTTMPILTERSIVVAAKDQVSCDLNGEAAILGLNKGVYYGLDPIGAKVWSLLQQPRRVSEIRDAVLQEYEVEPERWQKDLLSLLERLQAEELIEVRNEPG